MQAALLLPQEMAKHMLSKELKMLQQAMASPEWPLWKGALDAEKEGLSDNGKNWNQFSIIKSAKTQKSKNT